MNCFCFESKQDLLSEQGLKVLKEQWRKYAVKHNKGLLDKPVKHFLFNDALIRKNKNGFNFTLYPSLVQRNCGKTKVFNFE